MNNTETGAGGNGIIILRYPSSLNITVTEGTIQQSTTVVGSDKVTEFGRRFNYGNTTTDTATIVFSN